MEVKLNVITAVPLGGKYAQGKSAYVDEVDAVVLKSKWSLTREGYVQATIARSRKLLHRYT